MWDISSPSPYKPSEDPKGDKRPVANRAPSLPTGLWNGHHSAGTGSIYGLTDSNVDVKPSRRASLAEATAGPQVIRRMAWRELDFYGLRQRATPWLRSLALDSENVYVIEEEHRWAAGQHSSLSPPRVHLVRSTGIPVIPAPTQFTEKSYPVAARSASDLNAVTGQNDPKPSTLNDIVGGPVYGPIWVDYCGANGDVNMNFCWRVADANGTGRPRTASGGASPQPAEDRSREDLNDQQPRPRAPKNPVGWPWSQGETALSKPTFASESNRWPGLAPCWRHEDFPYLTVTEMVDFAAGVRVAARRCFMLETLSAHVKPTVTFDATNRSPADLDNGGGGRSTRRRSSSGGAVSARSNEVHFPDHMWSELVAKGHIAGDERWIVGEDERGRITIVRF